MVALAVVSGIIALFTPIPGNVFTAWRWSFKCALFMVTCKDVKKAKAAPAKLQRARNRRVRVVFIRHGESIWNALFNRFGVTWPFRAVRYLVEGALLFVGNRHDSVIIDSPLSPKGEQQAAELAAFVKTPAGRNAIPFDPQTSVVVCSNLRRAMGTAVAGLDARLRANRGEKITIDSSLQEGSRNADAQSFMTAKYRLVDAPVLGYQSAVELGQTFDPSLSLGNKSRSSNVYQRMDAFAARIFGEGPDGHPALPGNSPSVVVAVGHSLWFRNFFGRYLPSTSQHIAKKKKMKNCAVVSFDLVVDADGAVFVDEGSIVANHLGFAK
jgi:broad specificity phosphatase PhoE